jgi:hypothetical protein
MMTLNICTFPESYFYNLIDEYGGLGYDAVQAFMQTYMRQHVQHAQNLIQIFNSLSKSLTDTGRGLELS